MIIILSPSKTMDTVTPATVPDHSQPLFLDEAAALVAEVKTRSLGDLKAMLSVSDKLAQLNYERFQAWSKSAESGDARQAIFTFKGDAYVSLDGFSLSSADINYAQLHLLVLSGLYGMLRPLDLMQPYRLEMGGAFAPSGYRSMLDFWKDRITQGLKLILAADPVPVLMNLASTEYSSAIAMNALGASVVTPHFLDNKNGTYKVVSSFAKKARGSMARWIIENRIDDPVLVSEFNAAGYCYSPERSTDDSPVFVR